MEDLDSFKQKAEIVERIQRINEQLEELNIIGDGLCEKEHCEVGVKLKLVDKLEREKEVATDELEDNPMKMFAISWGEGVDEDKYTDSVDIDLTDRSAIKMVGFLMQELQEEREFLMEQL